jgi:hypothetical protein
MESNDEKFNEKLLKELEDRREDFLKDELKKYENIKFVVANNEEKDKEGIINEIKANIILQYNKNRQKDWSEIAARQLYDLFYIKRKNENRTEK